jgi:hypothetical protein
MSEAHPTPCPALSDTAIHAIRIYPVPVELILFSVQAPHAMTPALLQELTEVAVPTFERLVARFEQDRDSLSPLLIEFGRWVLQYYIPTCEVFQRYPGLETVYEIMRSHLPSDLIALHEHHKAQAQ